jgi:putative ABC transport system permease protein
MRTVRLMLRQMRRNFLMTAVNLIGLTISTSVLILLGLLIYHELDFNHPVPNSDRLVLVGSYIKQANGQELKWPIIAAKVPIDLQREIPAVDSYVRIRGNWLSDVALTRDDVQVTTKGVVLVDSTFFDVTGINLAQGDPTSALAAPGSAVITRSFARKMFGDRDPIGEEMLYRGNRSISVTGVIESMPVPSIFADMNVLVSWSSMNVEDQPRWNSNINYYCLLKLSPGLGVDDIRSAVDDATERHNERFNVPEHFGVHLSLTPLTDVHLFGDFDPFPLQSGRFTFVLQFVAIGIFLLLIATLNYVNLTTAQSMKRGMFVGVAKVLGANRSALMRQFITEAVLLAVLAMAAGAFIAVLLVPAFSSMVNIQLDRVVSELPALPMVFLLGAVVYGILLGFGPALLLSGVSPLFALRGESKSGQSGSRLRSALVILQFAVASGLIVSSFTVLRQMEYIRTADIGYNREHVIAVRLGNWDLMQEYRAIYDRFSNNPYILSSSAADHLPVTSGNTSSYRVPGKPEDEAVFMSQRRVDHNYIETLGMNLVAGRNFDPDRSLDSVNAVIVNRTASHVLGFGDDPIGKTFNSVRYPKTGEYGEAEIIGMIEDYQIESMRNGYTPIFMRIYEGYPPWLIFRLQPGSEARAIDDLEAIWGEFAPGIPLQFSFLDEQFNALYRTEERLSRLFRLFTVVSIIVAGMGLFALSAFVAERRTKEIGVRKVLGADVGQIVALLAGEFLKLVALANLIAWPLSWWVMSRWLQGYAFRTDLEWWIFAATFGLSILIAALTVSSHAIRASLTNPVDALRNE